MTKLPKPKHKLGYPESQLRQIIKSLGIPWERFVNAFGVNTQAISKTGETIFYVVDVERALWELGCKSGKWHAWD